MSEIGMVFAVKLPDLLRDTLHRITLKNVLTGYNWSGVMRVNRDGSTDQMENFKVLQGIVSLLKRKH